MSMFILRHTNVAVLVIWLLALGAVGGAVVAVWRFRIIRSLRERLSEAEARIQEYLDRIVELTKDSPDAVEGHPYRTAAKKASNGDSADKKDKKTGTEKDPRFDKYDRLRWRGIDEFACQVCEHTECESPVKYFSGDCPNKHDGPHIHATCAKCHAVISYGMAHDNAIYRSDIKPKPASGTGSEEHS